MPREYSVRLECRVTVDDDITRPDVKEVGPSDDMDEEADDYFLAEDLGRQRRLLAAILNHEGVLDRVVRRKLFEYLSEDEEQVREALGAGEEELEYLVGPAVDGMHKNDAVFFLAYSCEGTFQENTNLVWESFKINPLKITIKEKIVS